MTKGELLKILKNIPDDVPLYFNIEDPRDNDPDYNWDTWNVEVVAEAELCNGKGEYCNRLEPEMMYEIVFFIKPNIKGNKNG